MNYGLFFNLFLVVVFAAIWFCIFGFLRKSKKASRLYLLFFSIFYVYIFAVLHYTIFQFQSLLLLKYFVPKLILGTQPNSLNLIPLVSLTTQDLQTSLLNILLFIPFGFGPPFVAKFRLRKIVALGALFSTSIELVQLLTGIIAKATFRIADINDLIFNTLGAAVGVALFVGVAKISRRLSCRHEGTPGKFLRYVAARPLVF